MHGYARAPDVLVCIISQPDHQQYLRHSYHQKDLANPLVCVYHKRRKTLEYGDKLVEYQAYFWLRCW